jgi:8-amino-7-oxononanoate synthase
MNRIKERLERRMAENAKRFLRTTEGMIDFCSNDYLGIATNHLLKGSENDKNSTGSGGSRLLSGNYELIEKTEDKIASFHKAESGLIFNSGYDANLGLLSCVGQKGDVILYDSLSHASIRDGIRLSFAESFAFRHNDVEDLERKLRTATGDVSSNVKAALGQVYVVTESLFSMDGDFAPLKDMVAVCKQYEAQLIVDEAHATGIVGVCGEGLVQESELTNECFARIHTFGKALGNHGAIVLGSCDLRDYLINFSRAFMYTTALPPTSVATIGAAYDLFPGMVEERKHLEVLVNTFRAAKLRFEKLDSLTAIQGVIVPGNQEVRELASNLQQQGIDVRPILYPTVPQGKERLRIILHSFNTQDELEKLISCLS